MTVTYPVSDHAGGLTCPCCERAIEPGQPYAQVPDGMAGDKPVVVCVCVYCAAMP